jgi:alkylated DNA repair dioxygenase AlkB
MKDFLMNATQSASVESSDSLEPMPIRYIPDFVPDCAGAYQALISELEWVHAGTTVPRLEYYVHEQGLPYRYGYDKFARTYTSQPTHPVIESIRAALANQLDVVFDVVFLNQYEHQHHHLGWHADDSPEMSDFHPIVTVSLGAEREIWFRKNGSGNEGVQRILLENGSACVMLPGMQDTHQHRIPKCSHPCGPRISLTFRKFVYPTTP